MNHRMRTVFACGLTALLLLFSGCTRKVTRTAGTPDNVLAYGVYTAATLDSGLSVKLSLNQTSTYSKKKFQGSCFIIEYKGEWTCDNESIDFHLTEIRHRPDCNTEDWQVEKTDKHTRRLIRGVTMKSFELLDQDDQSSDEWVKFIKR
jgi:Ser-tRNA(Ala) deacylase AlaX